MTQRKNVMFAKNE